MPKNSIVDISQFFNEISEYNYLCKGCGVCVGVCPTNSLSMKKNEFAEYIAVFNKIDCIACGKCTKVCPGKEIFQLKDKSLIGANLGVYLAYSNDTDIRKAGSSGGVISALSSFAIDEGFADKAIMLKDAISPVSQISKTKEQINKCASSKYMYYPSGDQYKELSENSIITSLPCQASGIRAATSKGIVFGLFCSKAATSNLIKYISKKEGFDVSDINSLDFRHGNWPGCVRISTKQKDIEIPYNRSYYTAAFNSSLFAPQGCLFCNDYMSDKADIAFGDPWSPKLNKILSGGLGHSLVIVRTEKGKQIFDLAVKNSIISIESIDENTIIEGHIHGIFSKRSGLLQRLKYLERKKLPIPTYKKDDIIKAPWYTLVFERFYVHNTFYYKRKNRFNKVFSFSKNKVFYSRFLVAFLQRFLMKRAKYLQKIKIKYAN